MAPQPRYELSTTVYITSYTYTQTPQADDTRAFTWTMETQIAEIFTLSDTEAEASSSLPPLSSSSISGGFSDRFVADETSSSERRGSDYSTSHPTPFATGSSSFSTSYASSYYSRGGTFTSPSPTTPPPTPGHATPPPHHITPTPHPQTAATHAPTPTPTDLPRHHLPSHPTPLSPAEIAGVAVGGLAGLLLVAFLASFLCIRRRETRRRAKMDGPPPYAGYATETLRRSGAGRFYPHF